jgi:hypothetical protein
VSKDPIGFAGGMSWYGYANGYPVMRIDPDGLDAIVVIGGAVSDHLGGHAAVAIEGKGLYSFGTIRNDGTPLNSNLADQTAQRDQFPFRIPTTPKEDAVIVQCFSETRSQGYSMMADRSCSSAVCTGLVGIGVIHSSTPFPKQLMIKLDLLSPRPGLETASLPQNLPTSAVSQFQNFQPRTVGSDGGGSQGYVQPRK